MNFKLNHNKRKKIEINYDYLFNKNIHKIKKIYIFDFDINILNLNTPIYWLIYNFKNKTLTKKILSWSEYWKLYSNKINLESDKWLMLDFLFNWKDETKIIENKKLLKLIEDKIDKNKNDLNLPIVVVNDRNCFMAF